MTRNVQRRSLAAGVGLVMLLHGGSADVFARLVEVTDCAGGDAIESATRYVLTADIDCTGEPEPVVALADRSRLYLQGYTLTNGDVLCAGRCRIVGPGTISGGGVIGNGRVTVLRTTITGSPSNGVVATNTAGHGRATIVDSVIADNAMTGVEADRMTTLVRSRISGNGRHGVAVSLQAFNDCKRGRIRSWGSTVIDNGRDTACAGEVCADVATCARRGLALHTSGCDTSYELGSGMPGRNCAVCMLD